MAALNLPQEGRDFCGYEWRNKRGEHKCFEPLTHPNNWHICECGISPSSADRDRA